MVFNGLEMAENWKAKHLSLDELEKFAKRKKRENKTIVLAHGTFDLVHVGHIRHLSNASKEGDLLLVTITADKFVNKGPDRPIFSQELRAEMLSALSFVDAVAINDKISSVNVIETIRPNVYIKGSEYKSEHDDISGNIALERKTVEKYGGRLIFTDDITFSSSKLINENLEVFSPELNDFLKGYRKENKIEKILNLVESIKNYRVLLIGDTIIDQYEYVKPLGKPPKENLIATKFQSIETFPGGIIAAANHVASFCKEVDVLTLLGGTQPWEDHITTNIKSNVNLIKYVQSDGPTTRKLRYVDVAYTRKLFEIYYTNENPLPTEGEKFFINFIEDEAKKYDVIIVTDFGHGMITRDIIKTIENTKTFSAVNAQTNSDNAGFNLITKYKRADYICIDGPEARLAASNKTASISEIASQILPGMIDCPQIIVTTGREGCIVHTKGNVPRKIPVFTESAIDTMGAGDAFLSVTAPLLKAGGSIVDVGFIGNAVGAMKVGIVGHRASIEKTPLLKYLTTLLK